METLRTPDDRFDVLPGFAHAAKYADVADGDGRTLRMAYVDAGPAERERAAALMDRWTARAEALDQRWRDQLLEHKDAWSAIIRTAHETRLADPRDDDARGVSEQIVRQDGPTV